MKRHVREDERALFERTFEDAKPLRRAKRLAAKKPAKRAAGSAAAAVKSDMVLPKTGPKGIGSCTAERLRKGVLAPEATLDLHGMTEAAAHRALLAFLRTSHARGVRLVLVVTGKAPSGGRDAPFDLGLDRRARGVLHAMTPRWLKEPEFARLVADVRAAHRRHGGAGALYVCLHKPDARR